MDFIFENPLILVIIFGIISSLFKKSKGETKPNQGDPKPFEESSPIPIPDIFKQFDYEREEAPSNKKEISSEELLQSEYHAKAQAKIAQLQERNKRQVEEKPQRVEAPKLSPETVAPIDTTAASLNQHKLKEAVVWAEILGPPRSRKPHRYRNVR